MQRALFQKKLAILSLIVITAAIPAFFIQIDEPTWTLNAWKLTAKIGSLCGTVLLFWQFLLGYRQAIARWLMQDYLWIIKTHKWLGGLRSR